MKTLTIPKKMSNSGSVYDIASDLFDREIIFAPGCKYAVVISSYYGGKGYTTHRTPEAAIRASRGYWRGYSHTILDIDGNLYQINGDRLEGCLIRSHKPGKRPWQIIRMIRN